MAAKTFNCFICDLNPRVDGDIMCRSCKEEQPMCYECGQRRRNIPFKLCSKCYQSNQAQRQRPGSGLNLKRDDLDANLDAVVNSLDSIALAPGESIKVTSSRSSVLKPLKNDQNTYKEIAKHFKKEWIKITSTVKQPPELLEIFAIQNPEIERKFQGYGSGIRKSGKASNSELFFHGTKVLCDIISTQTCCSDTECGICGISLHGFDEKRIGTNIRFQRFGKGIYLAPNSSKCHDYTQGNPAYGVRAQLLCLVAQGARYELKQDNTKLAEAPDGFNSVYGEKGGSLNYDEIVVFDSGAVWPQYAVVYELNGVDKIAK